jgi:hypothetical protein
LWYISKQTALQQVLQQVLQLGLLRVLQQVLRLGLLRVLQQVLRLGLRLGLLLEMLHKKHQVIQMQDLKQFLQHM